MRIAIAEDSAILRAGLAELLAGRGHHITAAVGDAAALLAAVAAEAPDVAIVDIRMPPTHTDEGIRAALELRRTHPDVGVLVSPNTWRPVRRPVVRRPPRQAWATCSRTGWPKCPLS